MADLLDGLLADLAAEGDELDALLRPLDGAGWARPTPAAGWTVATQVAHLAWTDEMALLAVADPETFGRALAELARTPDAESVVDRVAHDLARDAGEPLLRRWRSGRTALRDALRAVPPASKVAWFGPPMSAASMATARLMETWAHGQDVADALEVARPATDRLRHVARLAVRTRDFAFRLHSRPVPAQEFRIELQSPGGDVWAFGPPDAAQRVTGPALDFCLLSVQRVARGDTALRAVGADADAWLDLMQAFAGPPGQGRTPRDGAGRPR